MAGMTCLPWKVLQTLVTIKSSSLVTRPSEIAKRLAFFALLMLVQLPLAREYVLSHCRNLERNQKDDSPL